MFKALPEAMPTGDLFQVAIDLMDDDQTQEINRGAAQVRDFFDQTTKKITSKLDGIEWGE